MTDEQIAQEVVFLIAERKGTATTIVDMKTGQRRQQVNMDRNDLIKAIRLSKQLVELIGK